MKYTYILLRNFCTECRHCKFASIYVLMAYLTKSSQQKFINHNLFYHWNGNLQYLYKIAAHIALSKIVQYYMLLFVRNACNKNPLHSFSPIFSTLANDVKKGIVYSSMTSNQCLMYNVMIESLYFTVWRIFRL